MPELVFSEEIGNYFDDLAAKNEQCYEVARKARRVGKDPKTEVEVPQAQDLASRVEKLLEDYNVTGVAEVIRKLTDEYGNREIVSLKAAEYMATKSEGMSREKALDRAIRVGLAVLTEGILVAPLEGIADTKIKQNADGTEFVDLMFAGPIRAAGGTAQAMSVLLADIVRVKLGIGKYQPTEGEINRFLEEIPLYKQCQHIQYSPSNEEIKLIVGNCPIMIDGEGTERMEISGFRDLPRIGTNQVRGGACLVVAEGMCLKAAKLQKHVKKLEMQGWEFMDQYLAMKGAAVATDKDAKRELKPSDKYLKDIVAGRPIFGHPMATGGFRLRYGRARTSGLASLAFSPASMYVLDSFPALGTQLKIERPGKACVVTPCDKLDGPIVLLKNGDLIQCQTSQEAQEVKGKVAEIVDTGEVLVPFGEFCENNHFLVPCGYPIEWHVQEIEEYFEDQYAKETGPDGRENGQILREKAEKAVREKIDSESDPEKKAKLEKKFESDVEAKYRSELKKAADAKSKLPEDWEQPTWERCKEMSRTMGVPMHPYYNLFWFDVALDRLQGLRRFILENGSFKDGSLTVPKEALSKRVMEDLGALHRVVDEQVIVDARYSEPLIECLGLDHDGGTIKEVRPLEGDSVLNAVSSALGIEVRARARTRIGMRMGRPEKAKDRKGSPILHGLFPIKTDITPTKSLTDAVSTLRTSSIQKKTLDLVMCPRECPICGGITYRSWCRECNAHTEPRVKKDSEGRFVSVRDAMKVDVVSEFDAACKTLGINTVPELKVEDELISRLKVPEALEKGILRQKYDLGVYKDGTIRFDMSDIPTTHFKPREIGLSIEKAHELGYTHDWNGAPLTDENQIVEIKPQDFIPNVECGRYLCNVAKFVDDLLENFYGMERFYNPEKREDFNRKDLIGQMFIALAPHTSGGILCRLIGYTTASGCYAHPYFHAAKRRNCDGDEDCIMLLLDGLINFSKMYLPDRRGGLMDAPLVLTTRLDPSEIDKEAQNVDCLRRYPIEFYRAAMQMKDTKDVEKMMDLVAGRIGTYRQYETLGFTHDTYDINDGPTHSAYTTLETMMDKMDGQLSLAKKIRAVKENDVATRVIDKHFMPDMIGNFRSFSTQSLRCTKCGAKYRRVPLTGVCTECGNKLTMTVHEASVRKYLKVSKEVSEKYGLSDYTRERIEILELGMDSLFNNDRVKKCKLTDFF